MYPKVERALVAYQHDWRDRDVYLQGDYIRVLDNRGVWHKGRLAGIGRDEVKIMTEAGPVHIKFKYIDAIGGIENGKF